MHHRSPLRRIRSGTALWLWSEGRSLTRHRNYSPSLHLSCCVLLFEESSSLLAMRNFGSKVQPTAPFNQMPQATTSLRLGSFETIWQPWLGPGSTAFEFTPCRRVGCWMSPKLTVFASWSAFLGSSIL